MLMVVDAQTLYMNLMLIIGAVLLLVPVLLLLFVACTGLKAHADLAWSSPTV